MESPYWCVMVEHVRMDLPERDLSANFTLVWRNCFEFTLTNRYPKRVLEVVVRLPSL
jgi:hypothetical protein